MTMIACRLFPKEENVGSQGQNHRISVLFYSQNTGPWTSTMKNLRGHFGKEGSTVFSQTPLTGISLGPTTSMSGSKTGESSTRPSAITYSLVSHLSGHHSDWASSAGSILHLFTKSRWIKWTPFLWSSWFSFLFWWWWRYVKSNRFKL